MHIFFSGIGGHGIGPLALIAHQAGYEVSGSDKRRSLETDEMQRLGVRVHIGQTAQAIAAEHANHPIDWLVYSSAVAHEQPDHPELIFVRQHGIRHSKRDKLLNQILADKGLQLIAVAGTHGKTTTTAMIVWLCKALGLPVSYSVGAPISFGPMGAFDTNSRYFVYECDEFDRNFLEFHPFLSLISGISWDHHEIFPTREAYNQAFRDFIAQSQATIAWRRDAQYVSLPASPAITLLDTADPAIDTIKLAGRFTREDAWLAITAVCQLSGRPWAEAQAAMDRFPGSRQRMELLAPGLYTNYAHTPEKIRGGMSAALEIAQAAGKDLVVVYEPLTNRRQHYIQNDYQDCFRGAKKVYWVPTYLAREDADVPVLTPAELIARLDNPDIAEPAELDGALLAAIRRHLAGGDMVVAMGASGGGSMDEWLRQAFQTAAI